MPVTELAWIPSATPRSIPPALVEAGWKGMEAQSQVRLFLRLFLRLSAFASLEWGVHLFRVTDFIHYPIFPASFPVFHLFRVPLVDLFFLRL
jgi:hypothetical protein